MKLRIIESEEKLNESHGSVIPRIEKLFDENGVKYEKDNGDILIPKEPIMDKYDSNLTKAYDVLEDEFGLEDDIRLNRGPNSIKSEWTKYDTYHFQVNGENPARLSELSIVNSPKPLPEYLKYYYRAAIDFIESLYPDDYSVYTSDIIAALAFLKENYPKLSDKEISQLKDKLFREYHIFE